MFYTVPENPFKCQCGIVLCGKKFFVGGLSCSKEEGHDGECDNSNIQKTRVLDR